MIVYFADRKLNIIGTAGTGLQSGLVVTEDNKTEDIESGIATFEGTLNWTDENRSLCESCVEVTNYVLRSSEDEREIYTITECEIDTKGHTAHFYAEDAGLSLLNEVTLDYPPDNGTSADMTLTAWFEIYLTGTGFQIGVNEANGVATTKSFQLSEQTLTERLRTIADEFGYEIGYSYSISDEEFRVEKLYVDIYKKRGKNDGVTLRLNQEIDNITIKKDASNVVTSLMVYGPNKETLDGYTYQSDENDFVVGNQFFPDRNETHACLQSPSALSVYGRIVNGEQHHVTALFNSESAEQAKMAEEAAKELSKRVEPDINYECDVSVLPERVSIGDTVYIVDEQGELYLESRLLKIETSVSDNKQTVTLGDFLLRSGGISDTVYALASQFQEIAANRSFYTWFAYADDDQGVNLSKTKLLSSRYLGIAANQKTEDYDIPIDSSELADLKAKFKWSALEEGGGTGISITITSSAGTLFKTQNIATTLTAHVYLEGVELSAQEIAGIGTLYWYLNGSSTASYTGQAVTITNSNVTPQDYIVQLEG